MSLTLLRHGERQISLNYKTILCAVDFDESARTALNHAKFLTSKTGGALHVLHVAALPEKANTLLRNPQWGHLAPAYYRLRCLAESELEGVKHEIHIRFASPSEVAQSILETADELQADLLVVATHGRTGIPRLFLGSIAQELVRGAGCPVLSVRA